MRRRRMVAYFASVRGRIARHLPVPLAAPESMALAAARRRVIGALLLLALTCLGAGVLSAISPLLPAVLALALLVYLAIQLPLWLRAKLRADHAWLMRECEHD